MDWTESLIEQTDDKYTKMKCLGQQDEHASFRCSCGTEFDVDAILQENLTILNKVQFEQCPSCNKINIRALYNE